MQLTNKQKHIIIAAITAIIAIVAVWRFQDRLKAEAQSWKQWFTVTLTNIAQGKTPLVGPASGTPTSTCSFPVTSKSNPECIREAFKKSGYLQELEDTIKQGRNPASYLSDAQKDPAAWLDAHPHLFNKPEWFKPAVSAKTYTYSPSTYKGPGEYAY